MFARLRERRTLYVCTSKPTVFATRILEHFGIANAFEAIFGSELDGTHADKRVLLSYVLERTRIRRHRAVMIGDRSHDMIAAFANGVAAGGVAWGCGSRAELRDAGAEAIFDRPQTLTVAALDAVCRASADVRELPR